jgi:ABC-type Fe3+-hydroxamate transport system substrate-binding protein
MVRMLTGLAVALLLGSAANGDSFKMKDGRYASGPVTVLDLTPQQVVTAKTKRIVVLSPQQKALVKRDTGKGPTVLSLYSLKVAGLDCTDFDYNIAIWFQPTRVEVPHAFVMSDAEAEAKADEFEAVR